MALLTRLPAFAKAVLHTHGITGEVSKRSIAFGPAADGPHERQVAADVAARRARFRAELTAGLPGADMTAANATIDAFEAAAATFATAYLNLQTIYDARQQVRASA